MGFILRFKVMYLLPEGGEHDRNMQHVLTGLLKFVEVDGNACINF
jgi:hypothetical protein